MILTMSGFLNLWWPLLQRQDTQAHSSLTYSLPWNLSPHGFRVPDGKERPTTGESSVNIFRVGLGIQSRNSWYDTFYWSLSEFSPSEQREGTAEPSVASYLIEKLPDETSPNRTEEETTARNVCAVAFAGEFFFYQSKYKLCRKMSTGGADTVSHHAFLDQTFYEHYNIRRFQQSTHFSWQWPSTLRSRRRLKMSLTRSLAIVCPNSTIDQTSHISTPWWKSPWDGNLSFLWVRNNNLLNHLNTDDLKQSSYRSQFKIWRWI